MSDELIKQLRDAADPFVRLVEMNDRLRISDDESLRDNLPRVWPLYGDLRQLVRHIKAITE